MIETKGKARVRTTQSSLSPSSPAAVSHIFYLAARAISRRSMTQLFIQLEVTLCPRDDSNVRHTVEESVEGRDGGLTGLTGRSFPSRAPYVRMSFLLHTRAADADAATARPRKQATRHGSRPNPCRVTEISTHLNGLIHPRVP
jgi:hypothetical protein